LHQRRIDCPKAKRGTDSAALVSDGSPDGVIVMDGPLGLAYALAVLVIDREANSPPLF
jgi:hypothetical protein